MSATQQLRDQFLQGRERFLALQPRERWMVVVMAVFVLATVLWLGVFDPVIKAHASRAEALKTARAVAVRLEQAAQQVQVARSQGGGARSIGATSLLTAVDQSTKSGGLGKPPAKMQPDGDREVRVWFEDVGFDAVVRWVAQLQSRGVKVQTMDVEPQSDAGSVNVRLSLVRGT